VHVPGVAAILTDLAQWHLLLAEQGVKVYANPALATIETEPGDQP
jgi:hypothetical protein